MRFTASILLCLAALVLPVKGALVTNEATFVAGLQPGSYLETFNGLAAGTVLSSPQSFSNGVFSYNASASLGLFALTVVENGDTALSSNSGNDPVTFTFTGAPVTAVGGFFFPTEVDGNATDVNGNPLPYTITLQFAGAPAETLVNLGAATFAGYISALPITSLTVSASDNQFPTINNLYVGAAVTQVGGVPEPMTAGLIGAGLLLMGGLGLRRKQR